MEKVNYRVERIQALEFRGHKQPYIPRYYGSPIIIICEKVSFHQGSGNIKEPITSKDPYIGNLLDIRI